MGEVPAAEVRLRVLGRPAVAADGVWQELRGKPALVLARLVVARGLPVSSDCLVEDVWSGRAGASAARTTVLRLRDALGPHRDAIRTVGSAYELDVVEFSVDVVEFESRLGRADRLAESDPVGSARCRASALELWRGRPYDGLDATFLDLERNHLEQRWLTASEQYALHATAELLSTEVDDLVDLAQHHPEREALVIAAMQALQRAGRIPAALELFQRHRTIVRETWGLDPSASINAYELELLTAGSGAANPRRRRQNVAFVGRDRELRTLFEVVSASAPDGRGAVIEGEPGVGKSELLSQLVTRSRPDQLLVVSCPQHPTRPMSALLDLMEAAIARSDDVVAVLDAGVRSLLARLSTELNRRLGPSTLTGPAERQHLVDQLFQALLVDGQTLVIDDFQWADETLVAVLTRLLSDPNRPSIIVAARPGCRDRWQPIFGADVGVEILELAGLELVEAAQLLEAQGVVVPSDLVGGLVAHTGGNPLFLLSYLDNGWPKRDEAPPAITDALALQVETLDSSTRVVLDLCAVLGQRFSLEVVETVMPDGVVLLEPAARLGLIRFEGQFAVFRHELLRSAVEGRIAEGRKIDLDDRIVVALEQCSADPAAIARHAVGAALFDPLRAVAALEAAGRYEESAFAFHAAATHYRLALETLRALDPALRAKLLIDVGRVERLASVPGHSASLFEGAETAAHHGFHELYVRAVAQLCDAGETTSGAVARSRVVPMLERALELDVPPEDAAALRLGATMTLTVAGQPERARALYLEGAELAADIGDDSLIEQAILCAYTGLVSPNDIDRLGEVSAEARRRSDASPRLSWSAAHYALVVGVTTGDRARVDSAMCDLRTALTISDEVVRRYGLACCEVSVAHIDGDIAAAEGHLERAYALGNAAYPSGWVEGNHRALLLATRCDEGRAGELAGRFSSVARSGVPPTGNGLAAAYVRLKAGDTAPGNVLLDRWSNGHFGVLPKNQLWVMGTHFCALIAIELGAREWASELFVALEPYSGQMIWSGVACFGPVDHTLGLLAELSDEHDRAHVLLGSALALCRRMRAPLMSDRVEAAMAGLGRT